MTPTRRKLRAFAAAGVAAALALWALQGSPPALVRDDLPTTRLRPAAPRLTAPPPAAAPPAVAAPPSRSEAPPAAAPRAPAAAAALETPAPPPPHDPGIEPAPWSYAIDADGIREAMQDQVEALDGCYDTLRAAYPEVQGTLKVRFQMVGEGTHTAIQVAELLDSTVDSTYLEGCVLATVRDLRFEPMPVGERLDVTYPLRFADEPDP